MTSWPKPVKTSANTTRPSWTARTGLAVGRSISMPFCDGGVPKRRLRRSPKRESDAPGDGPVERAAERPQREDDRILGARRAGQRMRPSS